MFRGKLLAQILHFNARHYIKHYGQGIRAASWCDLLIPTHMCQVDLIALKCSSTVEEFDFCSPAGVLFRSKV